MVSDHIKLFGDSKTTQTSIDIKHRIQALRLSMQSVECLSRELESKIADLNPLKSKESSEVPVVDLAKRFIELKE